MNIGQGYRLHNICQFCKFNPRTCGCDPNYCQDLETPKKEMKRKRNYYSGIISFGITVIVALAIIYAIARVINCI